MKDLKICRRKENVFTIIEVVPNYNVFPHDGIFPYDYRYYRIDTEDELLSVLNKEELFVEDIETIYYGTIDVTSKYIINKNMR